MRRFFVLLLAIAGAVLDAAVAPAPAAAGDAHLFDYKAFHANLARSAGTRPVLSVSGIIAPGAHRQFQAALTRQNLDLVVLDGPGGVLGEAFLIAEEVRRRGLSTLVAPNRSCASACAVVFLSGRTKYLGRGAAIGLHSASYADGRADPEATAIMAAYLRQLGVPRSTLRNMARTAPSDIRWLTAGEQKALGIRAYEEAR